MQISLLSTVISVLQQPWQWHCNSKQCIYYTLKDLKFQGLIEGENVGSFERLEVLLVLVALVVELFHNLNKALVENLLSSQMSAVNLN